MYKPVTNCKEIFSTLLAGDLKCLYSGPVCGYFVDVEVFPLGVGTMCASEKAAVGAKSVAD